MNGPARWRTRAGGLCVAALVAAGCKLTREPDPADHPAPDDHAESPRRVEPPPAAPPREDPPGTYLGRRIAPTMSHEAADWLTRPERDAEENSTRMLMELRLAPGETACDFGAGNGYHTLAMAELVRPRGRAVAVDIQPEMLALLRERARAQGITNVDTVLATQTDPKLPDGRCDLILLADVYHELDDPAAVLQRLRVALSPTGEIVLLEFRGEDPEVPIKPEHKMTKAQILRELEANGFHLTRAFDGLPWQHLMFFAPGSAP